jgi:sugar lactone lactonase YvrE
VSEPRVTIFSQHVCELGEGPSYDALRNRLFWFDIVNCKLLEKAWPDGVTRIHQLPEMASAIAPIDADRQMLFTETGLWIRHEADGRLELHCEIEADKPDTRSNDARVHPSGAFWLGTMGKSAQDKAGAIYWHLGGEVRRIYPSLSIPNSICFSPDGRVAYFTDSREGILYSVECDPANGLPKGEPRPLVDRRGVRGGIDGSVTDLEGKIWNAYWGGGSLDCYAPDGRLLESVAIPARQSSCPAFVGPNADRLVVTSAWQDMDEMERSADPEAGKTFLVDIEIRGKPEPNASL